MKAMWTGFVMAGVIAVAAYYVLQQTGFASADRGTSEAVRLN